MLVDFHDPFFYFYFPPTPHWEDALRKMGLQGPQWYCLYNLELLQKINSTFCPSWTDRAQAEAKRRKMQRESLKQAEEKEGFFASIEQHLVTKPVWYQYEGLWQLAQRRAFGLGLDPGLGKTKIVLDDFVIKKHSNHRLRMLVVCPSYLCYNWLYEELPKHQPGLKGIVLGRHCKGREFEIIDQWAEGEADVLIASYDYLKTKDSGKWKPDFIDSFPGVAKANETRGAIRKGHILRHILKTAQEGSTYLVADESHYCKSPDAARTKLMFLLADRSMYRYALTATPVCKDIRDAWSQLTFLDRNASGYPTFTGFKNRYCAFKNPYCPHQMTGVKNMAELQGTMSKWFMRLTMEQAGLDLPSKHHRTVRLEMPKIVEDQYEMMLKESRSSLLKLNGETAEITKHHILSKATALMQIANGYINDSELDLNALMAETDDPESMAGVKKKVNTIFLDDFKAQAIAEYITEKLQGKKVLVWSPYVAQRVMLRKVFNGLKGKDYHFSGYGDLTPESIGGDKALAAQIISDFQKSDGKTQLLMLSTGSFNTGITLTAADVIIYAGNTPNWSHRIQSEGRAYRLGLKHEIEYIDFLVHGTVDALVKEANLDGKTDFISQFVDYLGVNYNDNSRAFAPKGLVRRVC